MALIVQRRATVAAIPVAAIERLDNADAGTPPNGAGSAETKGPDTRWVMWGYGLVLAGAATAWVLFSWIDPEPFVAAAGFSAFAPLYVLAQSIERLMEPFTKYLGGTKEETKEGATAKLEQAVAGLNNGEDTAVAAASYLAVLTQIRRNTTVISWAIASASAMILCGVFGFQLLSATGLDVPWGGLDVGITGLAIGSGTKPLHDLISNLQKSKDAKSNPAEAATTG